LSYAHIYALSLSSSSLAPSHHALFVMDRGRRATGHPSCEWRRLNAMWHALEILVAVASIASAMTICMTVLEG
jgi:hypothetical protein